VQLKQEGSSLLLVIRQEGEAQAARKRFLAAQARLAEIGEWLRG
jgi:hypothetical protein